MVRLSLFCSVLFTGMTLNTFCEFAKGRQSASYEVVKHLVVPTSPKGTPAAAEVSIAINPINKNELTAGAMITGLMGPSRSNYSMHSKDGGKTWLTVSVPRPNGRIQGDDVVVYDHKGNVAHGFISFAGLDGRTAMKASGIHVITKKIDTEKWSEAVFVVDNPNSVEPLEDKPWFVFDRSSESKHLGNYYCSWTQIDKFGSKDEKHKSRIMFSRSVDGCKSFEKGVVVSDDEGNCVVGDTMVGGSTPSVDSKGNVFVVWVGPRGLKMDISRDGGKTFGKDIVVLGLPEGRNNSVDGIFRHFGLPVSGIDHSNGPFRDRLFINWIDERNGDKDVFLIYSDDQGQTWSKPKRVNNDKLNNGKEQFFTWMAVDPKDGSINIAFYDRRNTEGTGTQVTLARSVDGGKSFKNFHIKNQPEFKCIKGVFFGDYLGIDAYDGRVAVSYMNFYLDERLRQQKLRISTAIFDFILGKQTVK